MPRMPKAPAMPDSLYVYCTVIRSKSNPEFVIREFLIPYLALRQLCRAAGKQKAGSCHVRTLYLARRVADRTQRRTLY
jgi:hypothetical protein